MTTIVYSYRYFVGLLSLVVMLSGTTANGALIMSDDFSDNNRLQTGSLDGSWYFNHSGSTLSASGSLLQYVPGGTFRGITGTLPTAATLTNIGDVIELTFDFRYLTNPGNQGSGFRFGLYNSNGTPAADNGTALVASATTNNDPGYYFNLSTGTTQSHQLFRETGLIDGIMAGTDRVQIGANNTSVAGIADTSLHAGLLRITRTSPTEVTILARVDTTDYFNITTTELTPTLTFDQVAFGSANNNLTMQFDNVTVNFTPIPEPSSLALIGLGVCAAAGRWLRRKASV